MQYLLLGKRDKSFIQILGKARQSDIEESKRNIQLNDLKLSINEFDKLEKFYKDKVMQYELIVESCKDFQDLKDRLATKGYKILPQGNSAKFFVREEKFYDFILNAKKKS